MVCPDCSIIAGIVFCGNDQEHYKKNGCSKGFRKGFHCWIIWIFSFPLLYIRIGNSEQNITITLYFQINNAKSFIVRAQRYFLFCNTYFLQKNIGIFLVNRGFTIVYQGKTPGCKSLPATGKGRLTAGQI